MMTPPFLCHSKGVGDTRQHPKVLQIAPETAEQRKERPGEMARNHHWFPLLLIEAETSRALVPDPAPDTLGVLPHRPHNNPESWLLPLFPSAEAQRG